MQIRHNTAATNERPILAGRAGVYCEALPIPALRAHFQCVWTNSIAGHGPTRVAVVPDGCVDLMWRDGRFVVVGPDAIASNTVLQPRSTLVGLRFRPGAAGKWLGIPLHKIVGQTVPISELWGASADRMGEKLGAARNAAEMARAFQDSMVEMACRLDPPAPAASAMFALLGARKDRERPVVAALPDRLNMSERTLRRWSNEQFGYGPKTLDRILRFQRFRELSLGTATPSLADLAVAAGYADQAHLSREIRALCNMTAGEFVLQLSR